MASYEGDDPQRERSPKERSPSFPFIPLRKAIDRAEAMLAAHRRSPARIAVVGDTWGYSAASSGLVQTVAALKAYGLLEDVGRGEDRRVQLSELALRVISDSRPGAREAAIVEASRRPKLLGEYIVFWGRERPSDAHCISELTLDRGFTTDAARLFLRVYDDNLSFSGSVHSDIKEPISTAETVVVRRGLMVVNAEEDRPVSGREKQLVPPRRIEPPRVPSATLPLPEGMVTLAIPNGLSERSLGVLRSWLDVIITMASWQSEKPDAAAEEQNGKTGVFE